MDTSVKIAIIFILAFVALGVYQVQLPESTLANAAVLDQESINTCMKTCMRECVVGVGDEQPCLDKCNPACGVQ
jgi:hypothetical protein